MVDTRYHYTKGCIVCGRDFQVDRKRNDGKGGWGNTCSPACRELRIAQKKMQAKANIIANRALKEGDIELKDTCEICRKRGPVEMHHEDYRYPLWVTWVCKSCHGKLRR